MDLEPMLHVGTCRVECRDRIFQIKITGETDLNYSNPDEIHTPGISDKEPITGVDNVVTQLQFVSTERSGKSKI